MRRKSPFKQEELERKCVDLEEHMYRILNMKTSAEAMWSSERKNQQQYSASLLEEINHNAGVIRKLEDLETSNNGKLKQASIDFQNLHSVLEKISHDFTQLASDHTEQVEKASTDNVSELAELRQKVKDLKIEIKQADQDFMSAHTSRQKNIETFETRLIEGRAIDKRELESKIEKLEKDLKTAGARNHDLQSNVSELVELRQQVGDLQIENKQADREFISLLNSRRKEIETLETRFIQGRERDNMESESKIEQLKEELKTANDHNHDLHVILNNLNRP